MVQIQELLIRKAIRKHKTIYPCARKTEFGSCFTKEKNRVLFWFNTQDKSTHVVSAKVITAKRITRRNIATTASAVR